MDEAARLLTLLALVGGALTLAGTGMLWFLDETRRIRRTLTNALGSPPEPGLIVRGRGVGIGFNLPSNRVVVTWDRGAWRLDYSLAELMGVDLIVDRQVAARTFRGETRRPLDQLADPTEGVRLRFVFDDPAHPDFTLDLWQPGDDDIRGRLHADDALEEANRWMARMEALLRRPAAQAPTAPALLQVRPTPSPVAARASPPLERDDMDEDGPPWDDPDDDDPRAIT
ncbi:MAG: hypothetical protein ACK547_01965 [Alphaproteobacteria bacterium]